MYIIHYYFPPQYTLPPRTTPKSQNHKITILALWGISSRKETLNVKEIC